MRTSLDAMNYGSKDLLLFLVAKDAAFWFFVSFGKIYTLIFLEKVLIPERWLIFLLLLSPHWVKEYAIGFHLSLCVNLSICPFVHLSSCIIVPLSGFPRLFKAIIFAARILHVVHATRVHRVKSPKWQYNMSVCPSICPSVRISVCPSIHPSVRPYVCLSAHLSIRLSVWSSAELLQFLYLYSIVLILEMINITITNSSVGVKRHDKLIPTLVSEGPQRDPVEVICLYVCLYFCFSVCLSV